MHAADRVPAERGSTIAGNRDRSYSCSGNWARVWQLWHRLTWFMSSPEIKNAVMGPPRHVQECSSTLHHFHIGLSGRPPALNQPFSEGLLHPELASL